MCGVRGRYIAFGSFNIWVVLLNYLKTDPSELQMGNGVELAKAAVPQRAVVAESVNVEVRVEGASGTTAALAPASSEERSPGAPVAEPPSAADGSVAAPRAQRLRRVARMALAALSAPPVLGMFAGLFVGLIEPVQRCFFADGAPLQVVGLAAQALSGAAVPIVNLMLAFSLGHKLRSLTSWRELLGGGESGLTPRSLALATLGRMLLVPAIHGGLVYALLPYLPEGRVFRLLLFLEVAPPTASLLVVLAHVTRKPKAAQLAALALIPQYAVGVVSLTLVVAFALNVTADGASRSPPRL